MARAYRSSLGESIYRGYIIRAYDTMGNGKVYYEVWRSGMMWGFAASRDDAEVMIDRMIAKKEGK